MSESGRCVELFARLLRSMGLLDTRLLARVQNVRSSTYPTCRHSSQFPDFMVRSILFWIDRSTATNTGNNDGADIPVGNRMKVGNIEIPMFFLAKQSVAAKTKKAGAEKFAGGSGAGVLNQFSGTRK